MDHPTITEVVICLGTFALALGIIGLASWFIFRSK